ncbi:zinc transporter ZIP10 isoform X2 [Notolabrus celidotus]|uniref:zinc transporter ZIP10 isoform X2 n=1 Tax=Notolabrus celidotus TaxID=1203425 RepID=UPI00148F8D59|nr:zinc transporter ZIP10 isoform X2 [Notolabrus celidotus]
MRVHVHTKFCFLCVLTFLFHPSSRCNGEGHGHQHGGHQHADHNHVHNDLQISEAPYVRGATTPPEPTIHQTHSSEEEQQFYIQQLFRRYGNKDRLDFQGFQSLLLSLGLGEVKVVGLDHDELGHDHVAHLDLLDVKEGLHNHSPNKQGHGKGHPHHPHTDQVPTECSYHTTAINPASGAPTGPDHDHDHNHDQDAGQGHDHAKVEDRDHKHSDGHVQDTHVHQHDHNADHAHEKEHKHEQDRSKRKDQPPHDHSDHDHSTHDHSDHDHSDHDHSTHDHSNHERVKEQVQYNQKDLSSQPHIDRNHSDHDHSNHKHGDGDHSDHNHNKDHKHEQIQVQSENKDMSSHPRSGTTNSDHDHATHDHSDHDHTDHDNSNHDHSDHDHSDHDHGMERKDEQPQVRSGTKDLPSQPHSGHDHDHGQVHEVRTGTDTAPSNQLQQPPQVSPDPPPSATTESQTKRPRKPIRAGGQLGANKGTSLSDGHDHQHGQGHDHDHDHGHGHGHSHSHKRKREAPRGHAHPTLPGLGMSSHAGGKTHQHEECLNLTQLLTYYGLNPDAVISPAQFTHLCPALLYQIDSRVCIRHYHQMDVEQEELETKSSVWVWLWGFVSITIISLLSLLGVVLVPILNQACFKFLLTFLVALAVGTLSGDALLHLLPHSLQSQGTHDHDHHGHGTSQDTDLLIAFDGVWKGLTALAGIYLLFIIEHCIGMFKHYKDHKSKKEIEEGKIGRKLSDHKLNRRSDAEWLHLKPISEDHDVTVISCDNGHNDTHLTELQPPDSPTTRTPLAPQLATQEPQSPKKENGRKAKKQGHGHGHSHGGNCHSDQEMKDAGIASIAWMVIMGDGMHNFSDGLAIGAAFSANLTGGISTSVAVFCHELPHELGDFAVLLKAGMSVKQAIVYNLLSALMAYVGMLIGTAVGQYTNSVTSWIFAITAGMFLYVALVDMLPEMLHGDSEDYKRCQLGHFILQNLGMLTGFGIMLLIAIFEDQIVFDFGFK